MALRRPSELRVGIFVLVVLALVAGTIVALSTSRQLFARHYTLRAQFRNIQGLQQGAPVRLAGLTVGRVDTIRFAAPPAEKMVEVRLRVRTPLQSRIRADSTASILTIGLLGDKYVEITLGSATEPALGDNGLLIAREPTDLYAALEKGSQVLDSTLTIARSLDTLLATVARHDVQEEIGSAVKSVHRIARDIEAGDVRLTLTRVQRILAEVETGRGLLHSLIYAKPGQALPDIEATVTAVRRAADALTRVSEQAATFTDRATALADRATRLAEKAGDVTDQAGRAVDRATALTDTAAALVEKGSALADRVATGPGFLHTLLYDPAYRPLEDLAAAGAAARRLLADIEAGRGLLHALIYDPGAGTAAARLAPALDTFAQAAEAVRRVADDLEKSKGLLDALVRDPSHRTLLTDLRATAASLRTVSDELATGKGSLGALLQDPTVYEDLKRVLDGTRRSALVRFLVRFLQNRSAPDTAE